MTAYELKPKEFDLIRDKIFEIAGIRLNETKSALVINRLSKRIRHHNLDGFGEYIRLVEEHPGELQMMVNELTTNETSFFREPEHFEFLKAHLPKGHVRLWSAACSNGSEPYSLAMMLQETHGNHWELFASDISTKVLKMAKKGYYNMEKSVQIPNPYLKRYCLRGSGEMEGLFMIKPEIKRKIEFWKINLNARLPDIGTFDAILLRNVMIYFDNEKKKEIVEKLLPHIKKGGYLILGHSETLHGISDRYHQVRPTIYTPKA